MFKPLRVWCCLGLILSSTCVFAWNATGHMVVADIAYQNLQPDVRSEVDKLISYMHIEYPSITTIMDAATWPDAIRGQKIETFTRWHYVDQPFSQDGSALKNIIDTDNALWALKTLQAPLKNQRANQYERARLLAFFVHIVADIHQPLHTVSRISLTYPEGDRGGNLYVIRYNNGNKALHSVWDQGVGSFAGTVSQNNSRSIANQIMAKYPQGALGSKVNDLDFNHWAEEGALNAKNVVYTTKEGEAPSASYLSQGQVLSEQQAALAGYRLAALLTEFFKPSHHHSA